MPHRKSETTCIVRILKLRLSSEKQRQCHALREEAGRCWSYLVSAHVESRGDKWLTVNDMQKMTKGKYALHSQSVQALAQKLEANIETARELRVQEAAIGEVKTLYPHREKKYQTVVWKDQAIRVIEGKIVLSNGKLSSGPLVLKLPSQYHDSNIRKAELTWRADHYELCITIDTGNVNPPFLRQVKTAGIDMGEINIAAVVTDIGEGLIVSGRGLRSVKRLRNKRHAAYDKKLSLCQGDSRRAKRLRKRKAQASSKLYRQQRDILHRASRQVVNFCEKHNVANIAIGDVRDISDGVDRGYKANQKISQWPHGQFVRYVTYKGRSLGISSKYQVEAYSTRTCSVCGHVHSSAPRGRVFKCSGCGSIVHRDGNGGANICSAARFGVYGKVQVEKITYLRPWCRSSPADTRKVARDEREAQVL